jgi:hypothetical protein
MATGMDPLRGSVLRRDDSILLQEWIPYGDLFCVLVIPDQQEWIPYGDLLFQDSNTVLIRLADPVLYPEMR